MIALAFCAQGWDLELSLQAQTPDNHCAPMV
jgi:hypothetical protein